MMLGGRAMGKKPGRPKSAPDGNMRKSIVDAAADEFARAGYEGARIEKIAQAAGCNRSLVYFYFRDKAGLFQATLDDVAERRTAQMGGQPASLAEGLVYWFGQNLDDPLRIRLVMQEALAPASLNAAPVGRQAYLAGQLETVRAFQAAGLLRADLDPRHLLTLFLALTSFPACFPRVAAVSLDAADRRAMEEQWAACLGSVAALLAPDPEASS
jgi:AcrR family transcriptional regulator